MSESIVAEFTIPAGVVVHILDLPDMTQVDVYWKQPIVRKRFLLSSASMQRCGKMAIFDTLKKAVLKAMRRLQDMFYMGGFE